MKYAVAAVVGCQIGCLCADPIISMVSVTRTESVPHVVTLTYSLSEDAVVTFGVKTNGVQVSDRALWAVGGDVNRKIAATGTGVKRAMTWCPDSSFEGFKFDGKDIALELKAWSIETPPDYLVVDLKANSNVWYYASADAMPGGIEDVRYKEDFLAMRRIPAKGVHWVMGTSSNYLGQITRDGPDIACELAHKVCLTHDYYIGVYPVTFNQYAYVNPSASLDGRTPKNWVSYNTIRGSTVGACWPQYDTDGLFDAVASHAVDSSSWLSKARARTGLQWLDLPTEAQWEFAARAGEKGLLPYGEALTTNNLACYARCSSNKGSPDCEGRSASLATVGTYRANRWGLYDVLGNTFEWCLDWHENWNESGAGGGPIDPMVEVVDPAGPKTGSNRQERSSMYDASRQYSYLSVRYYAYKPESNSGYTGFRLALTLY